MSEKVAIDGWMVVKIALVGSVYTVVGVGVGVVVG